jgi:competence protein ComEC
LLLWRDAGRRLLIAGAAVGLLLGLEWQLRQQELPRGRLRVTFFDVGQGDAALIDLPDGRALLIDAGGSPNGGIDPGRAALLPVLQARRRDRIDIAVLSHPHPDHYGGLAALLDQLAVGEIWDSGQAEEEADLSPTSAEASALLSRARERGVRVRKPATLCGEPLRAEQATITVLAPCPGYDSGHDANDNSLVLRVDYRQRSVLFTGDAEQHAESRLLAAGSPLSADILKVGHHGSRTSSAAAFLKAVRPKLAIVSAGAGNPFGHPHAEVRARLRAHAGAVLELARTGGVIAETNGGPWRVRSWSGEELVR